MSVVDPITLGDLRITPIEFAGTSVVLKLESIARQPDGTDDVYTEVGQQSEQGGPDADPAFTYQAARPLVPIAAWEGLQLAATQVGLYLSAFAAPAANGATPPPTPAQVPPG